MRFFCQKTMKRVKMSKKYAEMSFVELAELYRVVVDKEQASVLKRESLEKNVEKLGSAYKKAQGELRVFLSESVDTDSEGMLVELGVRIAAGGADPETEDPDTEDPDTEADPERKPRRKRRVKRDD